MTQASKPKPIPESPQSKRSYAEALAAQRDRFVSDMEALKNKIAGLDLAIQLLTQGEELPSVTHAVGDKARQKGISDAIHRLLESAGAGGLSVVGAIEAAALEGVELNRSSVSSILSRMKRTGDLAYVNKRYVLKEFIRRDR